MSIIVNKLNIVIKMIISHNYEKYNNQYQGQIIRSILKYNGKKYLYIKPNKLLRLRDTKYK